MADPEADVEADVEEVPAAEPTKEERIAAMATDSLADSYKTNTLKEELVLAFVDNFRTQFIELYPLRRELLLTPPNECGVRKFVCTSIRPTQMPYKELYEVESAANFLADFLVYEPLEDP